MEFFSDAHSWVLVSFLIFAVLGLKLGLGKFFAMLDSKIAVIREDIQTAAKLRAEAEELLNKYQQKQADAAREANQIVSTARASADLIRREAEKDLQDMVARKEVQLGDRLKRMEETAKAEIQAYAAELAVKATSEIITSKLDQAANDRLIDASIKAVAGQLK
jgi:F-type H+-transporting ATPase subunit b